MGQKATDKETLPTQKSYRRTERLGKFKPKLRVIKDTGAPDAPEWSKEDVAYFKELHRIIDRIYDEAADHYEWTWEQLAAHANLGYSTVVKLGELQTIFPRFHTVYKLCRAVGWELVTQANPKKRAAPRLKVVNG